MNVVGVKDSRAQAWDMARARGLGLVGPGASDAVRALLVHLLAKQSASGSDRAEIVIASGDVPGLLGTEAGALNSTHRLHVVADEAEALNAMEAELLSRTRARHEGERLGDARPAQLVLVTRVQAVDERRLHAVLDNGSALGLAAVLVGHWSSGTTLRIRADGTVAVAAPPSAEAAFGGSRLFSAPMEDTRALVELLAEGTASGSTARRNKHTIGVQVLGAVRLTYEAPNASTTTDITDAFAQKQRELLAFLTLHRDGARRETVAGALWPRAPYNRPYNSLNATLSQVRRALRSATGSKVTDATRLSDGRHVLDQDQVIVDLWEFKSDLELSRRLVDDEEAACAALQRVVDLYKGDFAEDVVAEWVETPREEVRRNYLDAISTLVRYLSRTDPRHALHLLERARERDPYNEALYRDIARLQAQLGRLDAVRRTLELLKRSLAEIDEEPSATTVALYEALLGPGGPGTGSRAGPV
ncbi:BTAD domain-containing putative transcriptional regulator [Streptomyces sp. NPDC001663]|uniref:AfsR/SARP family transcriptional regulator n=1 Tax=Streptomyces sp. NPDC001663 TaxID=3364597 RepID=UPI0036B4BA93